jgi:hypothetical protein
MLHTVYDPREIIAERVRFTPADYAPTARCRGAHNRLGLAYQMGFLQLTGGSPPSSRSNCSTTGSFLARVRSPSIRQRSRPMPHGARRYRSTSTSSGSTWGFAPLARRSMMHSVAS